MYAIRQYEFGPAENLRYEEVADPRPGSGQVRIRVAASGVHVIDTSIRAGVRAGPFALPELPMTPGREVAGVVDDVGAGVDAGWLGTRVVAHLGQASGGYAELAVVAAESLHALDDGTSEPAAVAMIGTGRTTVGVLREARLRPDDVVLVPSAAGGMGSMLVQEAVRVGATVIGLAGGHAKLERVRTLGADAAIDYTAPGWVEAVRAALGGRALTVLLDGVRGKPGSDVVDLLSRGARVVSFGRSAYDAGEEVSTEQLEARGITDVAALGPRMTRRRGGLRGLEDEAMAALASGRFVPVLNDPFPLAKAADAHAALETRATTGKVTLAP